MEKAAGFTIIELLIVIAIISVIAAIAVPNLMSANIRAKASGAKADMGSIAIALEDYKVDYGEYPQDPRFSRLSTIYASDVIAEPNQSFDGRNGTDDSNDAIGLGYLVYPEAGLEPRYLKRIAGEPFNDNGKEDWNGSSGAHNRHYSYYTGKWDSVSGTSIDCTSSADSPQYWALLSYGPDKDQDITSYVGAKNAVNDGTNLYNPNNGITSSGDIVIIGP
jgi:prepilin-type N-terminal cleavage/methylation domain-containing protein